MPHSLSAWQQQVVRRRRRSRPAPQKRRFTPAFTLLDNDGVNHRKTLRALINAGDNLQLTERQGNTPLQLAWSRGYTELVLMLMLMRC